jgi:hypothetical protein
MRPASLTVRPATPSTASLEGAGQCRAFIVAGLPYAKRQMGPPRDAKKSCGSPGFIAGKRDNLPLDSHRQPEGLPTPSRVE